jgi:hypothetical protein
MRHRASADVDARIRRTSPIGHAFHALCKNRVYFTCQKLLFTCFVNVLSSNSAERSKWINMKKNYVKLNSDYYRTNKLKLSRVKFQQKSWHTRVKFQHKLWCTVTGKYNFRFRLKYFVRNSVWILSHILEIILSLPHTPVKYVNIITL